MAQTKWITAGTDRNVGYDEDWNVTEVYVHADPDTLGGLIICAPEDEEFADEDDEDGEEDEIAPQVIDNSGGDDGNDSFYSALNLNFD